MAKTGSTDPTREMSQDGADITAAASPAGGWGIRGWLSALFTAFKAAIDSTNTAVIVITRPHAEIHEGHKYYTEGHVTLDDGDPDPATGAYYIKLEIPNTAKWGHFTWTVTSNGIIDIKGYEGPTGGMTGGSRAVLHNNNRNCAWIGVHDGGNNQALLTKSGAAWTPDAFIGMQVFNQTDGSSGFVTDNDETTVTATLAGGTDNDWDNADIFEINNAQVVVTAGVLAPTTTGILFADTAFGGTGFKADVGGATAREDEVVARQNETYIMYLQSASDDNIITFHIDWYEKTNK